MVDHVSDSFIEGSTPLMMLVEAALNGHEKAVDESAGVFTEHAAKLVEVANLASANSVKMVRYAAHQTQNLCPQAINATWVLASRPRSKLAQDNMDVFGSTWENQVRILTDAVDDIHCIVTLDDFLAVSENHILITAEMDNYEPGYYTEKVMEAVKVLRNEFIPMFNSQVESAAAPIFKHLSGNHQDI